MVILLVEDEAESRHMTCEILEHLGHSVVSASTAEQAIELIKTRKFEVMVADIKLPGMSGIDLANIAIQSVPDIRVIFVSGCGYLIADKTNFPFYLLPKPYQAAQLEEALECIYAA